MAERKKYARFHSMTASVPPSRNSTRRVLLASLAGTTIEFFDFYIYGMAAVLVFPTQFFPKSDPAAAVLESLATFSIAFFARPVGAVLFGHFGDRIGRKATLVASLMTMGVSTVAIGLLPGYATMGAWAPALLALFRFGQGLGLGGEWGGAVLLATENAKPHQRAWFGMFPQLGAPVGFILSGGTFLLMSKMFTNEQFLAFAWRVPFIISSVLIMVGLYVRLKISETPEFQQAMKKHQRVAIPLWVLFRGHFKPLALGTLASISVFIIFYLLTVFCLSWGVKPLGINRELLLILQMAGVLFFALFIPISAVSAERFGRRVTMGCVTGGIILFGLVLAPLFQAGVWGALATFCIGYALMGANYGPLGTFLSELFPTEVRYTGASMAFNMSGILGASLAPYIATRLATSFGLATVGWYLSAAAALSLLALLFVHETRERPTP